MSPIETVLNKLPSARNRGTDWVARCPAHKDRTPSLTITAGDDGRALLHCFAGCQPKAIVEALGLTMRDLMPESSGSFDPKRAGHTPVAASRPTLRVVGNTAKKAEPVAESSASALEDRPAVWKEVARYDYTDADGVVLFTVVRRRDETTGKKSFFQVQPDGTVGLKGITTRPMFRLPAVQDAIRHGTPVVIVEGEKDVQTAEQLGWVATTNCGGSNGWRPEYAATFLHGDVVIVPDNDAPGRQWAEAVASSVAPVAKRVRIIALPGVAEKGDLTDWVAKGGNAVAFNGLVSRTPEWAVGDPIPEPRGRSRFRLLRADELQQLPPLRWLVDDVLPADALAALVGPSGKGKTFLTIGLSGAVATGGAWLGHPTGPAAPVLYIAAEGTAGLKQRVAAWMAAHGAPSEVPIYFICETVNLMSPEDVGHVTMAMASMTTPPALVVVDTLHRAMVGGDENSAKDVGVVVQHADQIRRECGCTVLIVHHNKKDADVERGSTALRGACDTMLMLRDDEDVRTLACEKQKDAEPFPPVTLAFEPTHGSMIVRALNAVERVKERHADPMHLTANERICLQALADADAGDGLTSTEWQRTAGVAERSFHRVKASLQRSCLVEKTDRGGRYRMAHAGLIALKHVGGGTATELPKTGVAVPKPRKSASLEGGSPLGLPSPLGSYRRDGRSGGSRSGKDRSAGPDGPPPGLMEWPDYGQGAA